MPHDSHIKFERINVNKAREIAKLDNAVLLDFRDEASFNSSHVKDAVFADGHAIPLLLSRLDENQPLVIYCYHGNSSQQLAQYIGAQEFSMVYSVDGGFDMWASQYPEDING